MANLSSIGNISTSMNGISLYVDLYLTKVLSFFDYLNDNNKRIILDEYPTSAYIAMFNDYKKTFSEFILEFKINKI
jgi:hypothetical protein